MTEPYRVGVTGTRHGLTYAQRDTAETLLLGIMAMSLEDDAVQLHHGDCVGADQQLNDLAQALGYYTVAHPPVVTRYQSDCMADAILTPRSYYARNQDIVRNTHRLLAFPYQSSEPVSGGGGTWWTIRYARKVGKTLTIVWPDGSCSYG